MGNHAELEKQEHNLVVCEEDRGVLAQFEPFTPSYTSRKNDAENNVEALEVEGGWGNHVELEKQATAIKYSDEEQQELLHKLLVYGGSVEDGVS